MENKKNVPVAAESEIEKVEKVEETVEKKVLTRKAELYDNTNFKGKVSKGFRVLLASYKDKSGKVNNCYKKVFLDESEMYIAVKSDNEEFEARIAQEIGKESGKTYFRLYVSLSDKYTKYVELNYSDVVVIEEEFADYFA